MSLASKLETEIKPSKLAFLMIKSRIFFWISIAFFALSTLVLMIGASPKDKNIQLTVFSVFLVLGFLVLVLGVVYFSIVYSKTKYLLTNKKFKVFGGGLFSNVEAELILGNITQVSMVLPFIENLLFKTGTVVVRAAGSDQDEIVFEHVKNPLEIYNQVEELMSQSSFDLGDSELVSNESPSITGVFLNSIYKIFTLLFLLAVFAPTILSIASNLNFFGLIAIIIAFLVYTCNMIAQFIWDKNAQYNLYKNKITYARHFLSRQYSFIPLQNVTDSDISQSFWDRIFQIHQVVVSCQGDENKIIFANLAQAPDFVQKINEATKQYKQSFKTKVNSKSESFEANSESAPTLTKINPVKEFVDRPQTDWQAILRPNFGRLVFTPFAIIVGFIVLAIITTLGLSIFTSVPNILNALGVILMIFLWPIMIVVFAFGAETFTKLFTTYFVDETKLGLDYQFISKKHTEFNLDRVTSLVIYSNPFDRLFNTYSLIFRSVGSNVPVVFKCIKRNESGLKEIKKKIGIKELSSDSEIIKPEYTFWSGVNAFLPFAISYFIIIIGFAIVSFNFSGYLPITIILITLALLFYIYLRWFYKTTEMVLDRDHVEFEQGVWIKNRYHAGYEHIRNTANTKFILSQKGRLNVDIVGQTKISDKQVLNFHFVLGFIPDVEKLHTKLDQILYKFGFKPSAKKAIKTLEITDYKHDYKTSTVTEIFINSLWTIWIFGLWPVVWIYTLLSSRSRHYYFSEEAIFQYRGIFYKTKVSVPYSRIDYINNSQGLFGKMFNSGNISIYTTGSSQAVLTLRNINDHEKAAEILYKLYSG